MVLNEDKNNSYIPKTFVRIAVRRSKIFNGGFIQMKKRILALSLAAAMVVGALASCNGSETTVTSSQAVEARDVALVLWGSEADQDFLKQMSADFATAYVADHEDVKSVTVDVKIVGEDNSATEALKDLNAAADVFGVPGDQTGALAEAKAIYAMPEAVVSEIKELVGEPTAAKTFYNGSYYGFPYSPNTAQALFYNKTLFTEDEVKSLNTMLEKDLGEDVKAFGMDEGAFFSSTWYFTAGGELFTNSDKNVCTFDSDECVEMLTWVQENAGRMYKGGTTDAAALLQDGKLAAYADGSWNAKALIDALGDNVAVTKLPEVTVNGKTMQMKCFGGVKYYAVNAASKEPEVAVALAQYLASPDVQLKKFEAKLAKNELVIPTALSLMNNAKINENPAVAAYMQQGDFIVVQEPVITNDWWGDAAALYKGIFEGTTKPENIKAEITKHIEAWKAM